MTASAFAEAALSFPGTEQVNHFERTGFKAAGKRLFATYLQKDHTVNIFLSPGEQALFCQIDATAIYPVANKWGEKGITTFKLDKVEKQIIIEALLSAYREVMS